MSAAKADTVGAPLSELLSQADRAADSSVGEFLRLATAVQRQRSAIGVSDTDHITRSTGLWVLMQVDTGVAAVLERAGLNQRRLGEMLTIREVPPPAADGEAELHPDFADAVRGYLAGFSSPRPLGTADLAIAILRSTVDESAEPSSGAESEVPPP